MGWEDLLVSNHQLVLPWLGGRKIYDRERTWKIQGALPPEHGWYTFDVSSGKKAVLSGAAELDLDFEEGRETVRGYIVGNRMILDSARVNPDPKKFVKQTTPVFLVEPGLDRFARAIAARTQDGHLVYLRQEFPDGSEAEVQEAYQDRLDSVSNIHGVSPALDMAFRWLSYQRLRAEEREREQERRRAEEEHKRALEERRQEAMRNAGTGLGRRTLAKVDFKAAAKAALAVSGAELLDVRASHNNSEMVVQYRFRRQRLECVVERETLRIIDSGICLTDHNTGEQGDRYFTLESLPIVVAQAIDEGVLVVYRHA